MTNLSINTTTRLPFFNATVTARQLSGSTTPVKFHTHSGEIIGLSVKTNARGYLCSSDGTPYVDGVFVSEDSIVTATLGDGSSTSWVVVAESDVSAFDGVLYGRKLSDGESKDNAVKVGSEWYKRLFSANQMTDGQLSYMDLSDTPGFTKWSEDQQIEFIDFSNVGNSQTISMGMQTKTLLLLPKEGTTPPPVQTQFKVVFQATLDQDGQSRFGRNLSVTNFTDKSLMLANATYDKDVFGRVGAWNTVTVAEVYPDARPGVQYGGEAAYRLADPHRIDLSSVEIGNYDELKIYDQSPEVIVIDKIGNTINGTRPIYVIPWNVKIPRRVIVKRADSNPGSVTLVHQSTGYALATLVPYSSVELLVGTDSVWCVNTPIVNTVDGGSVKLSSSGGELATVPVGCSAIVVDCSAASDQITAYPVVFPQSENSTVRIEFTNASKSIWIGLQGSSGMITRLSIPKGDSRVCVSNHRGIVTVDSVSWLDTATCDFTDNKWSVKANTLQYKLNLGEVCSLSKNMVGSIVGDNAIELGLPVEVGNAVVEIDVPDNYFNLVGGAVARWYLRLLGSNGKRMVDDAFGTILAAYQKVDLMLEPTGLHGRLLCSQSVRFSTTSADTDSDSYSDLTVLQRSPV